MAAKLSSNGGASPSLQALADTFSFLPASFVDQNLPDARSTKDTCMATAQALDKLIEILDLKTDLKSYKVPEGDLEKVAEEAYKAVSGKPGWKDLCPVKEDLLKHVLKPAY